MQNKPLISVIVPVYNVEKYVSECIESILRQSYKNVEIIIIDDGSTDGSGNICQEYASSNLRIKLFRLKNSGVGMARNYGINQATGNYVYFLDADDFIDKNLFQDLFRFIHKDYDIILFGYNKISEKGKFLRSQNPKSEKTDKLQDNKDLLAQNMLNGCGLAVWDKIIKRTLIIKSNIYFDRKKRGQDFTFVIKLYAKTKSIVSINKPLYNYRIIFGNKNKFDKDIVINHIKNFELLSNFFSDNTEIQNRFLSKIFSTWFFKVVPMHISKTQKIPFETKIYFMTNMFNNESLKEFLIKNKMKSKFENVMKYFFLKQKLTPFFLFGKLFGFARVLKYNK